MSDPLAQYLFLPWFRQGLATRITGPSTSTSKRVGFRVTLQVNELTENLIQKEVELYGPGDVIGFDPRVVVRTDPKRDISDFEPNYFPLIEFSEPDFPWRYTPLPAPATDVPARLDPWICLVVLRAELGKNGEQVEFKHKRRTEDQPLPSIEVKSQEISLPDLSQNWAWAHVQMTTSSDELESLGNGSSDINIAQLQIRLQEIQRTEPERLISRLLSPRRLEPGVLYHAFVVPTFESGRLTGLGLDPTVTEIAKTAWDISQGSAIDLPYYFDWEFRTGLRGDFEHLVRLLEPRELDKNSGVGMRDMDCADPGYLIPAVKRIDQNADESNRHILALEGALTTVDAEPTDWPRPDDPSGGFRDQLTALLNLPEEQLETEKDKYWIVPPIYGRWHTARKKLLAANRKWLNTLNLDPRHRATAGFGTLIVQDEQEKLMAEAWRQIGAVNEANELLRQAQLGRAGSQRILKRHLERLPYAQFIRLTGPVHARVLTNGQSTGGGAKVTVKHLLNRSPIPAAALEPAFRRIARPRGPLRGRQQSDAEPDRADILDRLNEGDVAAAGPIPSPDGAPGMGDISDGRRPPWAVGRLWRWLKRLHWILLILVPLVYLVIAVLSALDVNVTPTSPIVVAASVLLAIAALIMRRFITPGLLADNVQEEEITPERIRSTSGHPDFVLESPGSNFSPGPTGGQDSEAARVFRGFAATVQAFLNPSGEPEPEPKPIDIGAVRNTLVEVLEPRKTILNRVKKRLSFSGLLRGVDRLETIMATPEFHRPMYEPLRNRSQELLLPGVGKIPQNTLALLKTNQRFVEAYMVGLNHEIARELLWREYPTDQRGSCFRQFWDVSSFVPPASMLQELEQEASGDLAGKWNLMSPEEQETEVFSRLRERLKDIRPIHEWRDNDLAVNSARQAGSLKDKLVLLIRGDLLKKYPSTVIYASKAYWNEAKNARWPYFDQEEDHRKEPVLSGTLPPDITFLGFDLDRDEARGTPGPNSENPGWFFVMEERISETRFGMDAPLAIPEEHSFDTWDDLSWADLPEDNGLQPSGYVNVEAGPVPTNNPNNSYTWDSNAATISRITVQRPVRVAVHAEDMLPD